MKTGRQEKTLVAYASLVTLYKSYQMVGLVNIYHGKSALIKTLVIDLFESRDLDGKSQFAAICKTWGNTCDNYPRF